MATVLSQYDMYVIYWVQDSSLSVDANYDANYGRK